MKHLAMVFIVTTFWAATFLTGCQSPSEKVENAKENVTEAKEELKDAKAEAANEAKWKAYKVEAEAKIDANDALIADLRAMKKKTGKTADELYNQQIDALEKRNKDLRERIRVYNDNMNTDWEAFKREFEHDMDELGAALKDLTVDNKK